jgi:hypothetical protein
MAVCKQAERVVRWEDQVLQHVPYCFYPFAETEMKNAGALQNENVKHKKSTRRCFLSNPVYPKG